ncbi:MAG: hypothetical protein RIS47_71 [Bacteroidota bacterium]|jgi:putative glycerol-1-phosphate prenyltransferase
MDKSVNIAQNYFGSKSLALLIDPDKHTTSSLNTLLQEIKDWPIDLIFVGGSILAKPISPVIAQIKSITTKKVVLFPGNTLQIDNQADAILFLSLLSGRNPEFLIGQHVHAAPILYHSEIDIIPTAYILIDGGAVSSVEYISNTKPIPANKPDIAVATALAGKYLGMKTIYLEAGSGAQQSVSPHTVAAVKQHTQLPLIVGGGIRTLQQAEQIYAAGADCIVVGTAAEKSLLQLHEICTAKR